MFLIFFLLGAATVIALLAIHHHYVRWRLMKNPRADFSKPGVIPLGTFDRFLEGLDTLFPGAPARSYISLSAGRVAYYDVAGTRFFIRSAGKRDGKHSFLGELRLDTDDRDHAIDAIPMLERIGGPLERIDKSHGQLVLKTAKLEDVGDLIDVARAFSDRVLSASQDKPIMISWHIAGYHGSNPSS